MDTNELYHWGKKGMKWGVRRYQNKDGSLTDAGKKRYARDANEKGYNKYDESNKSYYKTSKKNGRDNLNVDAKRYVREDMERTKAVADSTANAARKLSEINDKQMKEKAQLHKENNKINLSDMTDQQLRDRINRAILEKQYNDMFAPKYVDKGRERAKKFLDIGSDVMAVTGSALSVALAVKKLGGW